MNEHLRQELAAWLEFYRELGIEDFYLRAPAAPTRAEATAGSSGRTVPAQRGTLDPASVVGATEAAAPPGDPNQPRLRTPSLTSPDTFQPSSVGPPARSLSLFEAPPRARGDETLEQIRDDLGDCQRCSLAGGRKHIVFGQGHPHAQLVFVGEGPGAEEDEQGVPFVGRAGQLLNRMLQLIGIKREEVYICNVVKCRPPENRTPGRDEVETCSPFLFRQIEAIQPRLVCCLGAPAVRTLLGVKEGMLKIRGRFYDYGCAKALATVHPAYVLRNPREEKILREDFEKIRQFLQTT